MQFVKLAPRALSAAVVVLAAGRQVNADDAVTRWNQYTMEAVRVNGGVPGQTSRVYGMMSAAVYDAVNAIDQGHQVFKVDARGLALGSDSKEAAATEAAFQVLDSLFPAQHAALLAHRNAELAFLGGQNAQSVANGIAIGQYVGTQLVSLRAGDGWVNAEVPGYTGGTNPGEWRPTAPGHVGGVGVNWGQVTPWTLTSASQFRPPPPPSLTSQEYTDAFNEVKDYGRATGSLRTQDQTDIAIFWANDRNGTYKPMGQYADAVRVVCEQRGLDIVQNARMFAMANVAQADAGIATWEAKYFYDFWRPVSAITDATGDGNANTAEEAGWQPLADLLPAPNTPPFPSYVSGHATFGAAAMWMAALELGDAQDFDLGTDENGQIRHFTSFQQAITENTDSRVWLGVHWRFDQTYGEALGKEIAEYINANFFLKVPAPGTLGLVPVVAAGLGWRRRR